MCKLDKHRVLQSAPFVHFLFLTLYYVISPHRLMRLTGLKVCSHRITQYLFWLRALSPSPLSWCGQMLSFLKSHVTCSSVHIRDDDWTMECKIDRFFGSSCQTSRILGQARLDIITTSYRVLFIYTNQVCYS